MSKRTPKATTPPTPIIRDLTFKLNHKAGVWTIIPHSEKGSDFVLNFLCQHFDSFVLREGETAGELAHVLIGRAFEASGALGLSVTSKVDLT